MALGLAETRLFVEAQALLTRALEHHPHDVWLNLSMAGALVNARPPRRTEALRHIARIVAARNGSVGAWVLQAAWLRNLGNYADARRVLEHALKVAPKAPSALLQHGYMQQLFGRYDQAIEAFEQVVRLRPKSPTGHLWVAGVHTARGEYPAAIRRIRRALQIDQSSGTANRMLGSCLYYQGKNKEAMRYFTRAKSLMPRHLGVRAALATRCMRSTRTTTRRFGCLGSAWRSRRTIRPPTRDSAATAGAPDGLDEAEKAYRDCLKIDARNSLAFEGLGLVASSRGNHPEAIRHYLTATADPDLPDRGGHEQPGELAGATVPLRERAQGVDGGRSDVAQGVRGPRGVRLLPGHARPYEQALEMANEGPAAPPRADRLLHTAIGQVHLYRGDFANAIAAFDESLKAWAESGSTLYLRGKAALLFNDLPTARASLRRALAHKRSVLGTSVSETSPQVIRETEWLFSLSDAMKDATARFDEVVVAGKSAPRDAKDAYALATLALVRGKPEKATGALRDRPGRRRRLGGEVAAPLPPVCGVRRGPGRQAQAGARVARRRPRGVQGGPGEEGDAAARRRAVRDARLEDHPLARSGARRTGRPPEGGGRGMEDVLEGRRRVVEGGRVDGRQRRASEHRGADRRAAGSR